MIFPLSFCATFVNKLIRLEIMNTIDYRSHNCFRVTYNRDNAKEISVLNFQSAFREAKRQSDHTIQMMQGRHNKE